MKQFFFLFFIAYSSIVSASTYYVATNGNDNNPGTISQPFATWQKGIDMAYPGDTVFLRGGVYYFTATIIMNRSGTLGNRIHIFGYPPDILQGNRPILDGVNKCAHMIPNASGDVYNGAISIWAEYIHLKDFTVRNIFQCPQPAKQTQPITGAISGETANMIYENITLHNIGQKGFFVNSGAWNDVDSIYAVDVMGVTPSAAAPVYQSDSTYWINCDVYELADTFSTKPGNHADAWKVSSYQRGLFHWYGCRAWNYTDDGFDPSGSGTRVFDNNWMMASKKYDNETFPGYEGNGVKTTTAGFAYRDKGIPLDWDGSPLVIFKRNLVLFSSIGIYIGAESDTTGNCYVINNTMYKNEYNLFSGFRSYTDVNYLIGEKFRNNIVHRSTVNDAGGQPMEVAIFNKSFDAQYNNFIYANRGSVPHWDWNPDITVTDADFQTTDSLELVALFTAPRQADGSLPAIRPLMLASNSKLIDAGTQVHETDGVDFTLGYYGSAPDLGYSEFISGSYTPPSPLYKSSVIENNTPTRLEVTYSLSLANKIPSASAFIVNVNSIARPVSSLAVSGSKVYLTLATPVVYGDIVTLAYNKPANNHLQTFEGGEAATFSAQPVTNKVGFFIPEYNGANIENATPTRLDMTYSLTLTNKVPASSAFAVRVNSVARNVTGVAISGNQVRLTLASPVVYGDMVIVSYTKPAANPLQTESGGQAVSVSNKIVTNNIAPPGPVFQTAVIENDTRARLDMSFNLTLANKVPPTSAFTVLVNSAARSVNALVISGSKVQLALASPVAFGDVITVAYTKPGTNPLQTSAGGQVATFTAKSVTNNVAPPSPVYSSAVIENSTPARLEMTYSLAMASIIPAPSAFMVKVNSVTRSVSTVNVSGTKVILLLATPVVNGDLVTVAYTKPGTNPLQTTSGGQAASLPAKAVTNNCLIAASQPPVVKFKSPTHGSLVRTHGRITFEVEASAPDGEVRRVEFFNGSVKIGESTSAPFSYIWDDATEGTHQVTAIATDNLNAVSAPAVVEISIALENDITDLLQLYPNPNDGRFSIDFLKSPKAEYYAITIVNIAGQNVYKEIFSSEVSTLQFDITQSADGMYVLMVAAGGRIVSTKKFIKNGTSFH